MDRENCILLRWCKFYSADQVHTPRGKIWRKPKEGLAPGCTAKGSHCCSGECLAKFMVAITYCEGVILCEQYDSLNGPYFKDFVEREFVPMFRDANKKWISSCRLDRIGAKLMPIPPHSVDLNPIENIFNMVKRIFAKTR